MGGGGLELEVPQEGQPGSRDGLTLRGGGTLLTRLALPEGICDGGHSGPVGLASQMTNPGAALTPA